MADGAVEVHRLQLVGDSSTLVNSLVKAGTNLSSFNQLVGKSDKELRRAEKQVDKAASAMERAAQTAARMKQNVRTLTAEVARSHKEAKSLAARLTTATRALTEQQAVVRSQRAVIKSLVKSNLDLAASYDKVTAAERRATMGATQRSGYRSLSTQFAGASPLGVNPLGQVTSNGTMPLRAINKELNNTARTVRSVNDGFNLATGGINALRYQLYGVTAAYGVLGTAVSAAGLAIIRHGIEWNKNFANVIRTSQVTGNAVNWLKDQFLELQTTIPVTSEDLAVIGTLGSQMGVVAAKLADFTETTAKFSATAGISADESATALSRLDQLLPDVNGNYATLASTILKTGVNAVATEQQIVRGTNQIAAIGRIANIATPDIVALASAMSSLGFSPELQRSVITSSFSKILAATAAVTDKTEKFGEVLNLTGKEFQQAWNADAVGTYERLLSTIASRGDAVVVLQSLGLASQRLTPNLLKLGQNTEVLDEALRDTRGEFGKTGELTRQYGVIADTVSARIQVLGQTWDALLVTLDSSDVLLKPLITGITDLLRSLRQIAKNPGVSAIASVGTMVVATAGAMTLGAAAAAALAAGYIAITEANIGLAATLSVNTAAELADAEATAVNAAAKLGLGEALVLATTATAGQTVALVANTAAMGESVAATGLASSGLLRFSSSVISSLPAVLKWTGLIGGATAVIAGLVASAYVLPDVFHEIEKAANGINLTGPDVAKKSIVFDTSKIKRATKDLAEFNASNNQLYDRRGNVINSPQFNIDVASKDLVDTINGLSTYEEKLAAVNQVARDLGVTQEDLLTNILPDLGSELGRDAAAAAEAADATQRLESAQALWAATLGSSDEAVKDLMDNVQVAANSFLDFGTTLESVYGDKGSKSILDFMAGIKSQVKDFQGFYTNLGKLVQRGGVQLAGFFASQGTSASQALTDSLTLSDKQIGQIEEQMTLAAFYASDAFKQTFAQNNAILAQVWEQSGHDPKAVAAFNKALNASIKGGAIDPSTIAKLESQYGVKLPIEMIPDVDPQQFEAALALEGANITPVRVPLEGSLDQGVLTQQVDAWVVSLEGHTITIPVDPNTEEGRAIIAEWRANEYQTPLSVRTFAETTTARAQLQAFHQWFKNLDWTAKAKAQISYAVYSGSVGSIPNGQQPPGSARGSLVGRGHLHYNNYPQFRRGTILRGPGTGTSDSILARVSTGEAITQARAVRYYGVRMMEDINRMRFPRFAGGGIVGNPNSSGGTTINATVVQNYPTTRDPIKQLKRDAENVIAGLWD